MTAAGKRCAEADGSESVLQCTACAHVHVHAAGGHQRQAGLPRMAFQLLQACAVVGAEQQLGCDPTAVRETGPEPAGVADIRFLSREQQREAAGHAVVQIRCGEMVFAFLRAAPRARDQLGEIAVAGAVGGEQDKAQCCAA
jgi:hypothetical protein